MAVEELELRIEEATGGLKKRLLRLIMRIRAKDLTLDWVICEHEQKEGLIYDLNSIKEKILSLLSEAEKIAENNRPNEDISPQEFWDIISKMKDEEVINLFNSLPISKRRLFSDFIFSHCNVFSGKGRLFSERFDSNNIILQ